MELTYSKELIHDQSMQIYGYLPQGKEELRLIRENAKWAECAYL